MLRATVSIEAIELVLSVALRSVVASWRSNFTSAALADKDAVAKVRALMLRFRLHPFHASPGTQLAAAARLAGETSPELLAGRVHEELSRQLEAAMAGDFSGLPARIVRVVEEQWPATLDRMARQLAQAAAGNGR
jgi:hypothetical protein